MTEQSVRTVPPQGGVVGAILAARERSLKELDGIVDVLHEARGATGDLQNVLVDLLARAGGGGGERDPLLRIGRQLGALTDSLGRISAQLGAERVNAICTGIRSQTRDIVRSGLEFQMVAKLTAITVASLPSRSVELETYADSFGHITQRLSVVSTEVEAQLGRVLQARAGALGDFGAARSDLRACHDLFTAEIERGRNSPSRDLEAEIGAAAGNLQDRARDELGRLIAAIQFADSYSQRSEHVVAALTMAEQGQPARAAALRRVAVALADDLVSGMRQNADVLRRSVRQLAEEGEAANAVLTSRLANGDMAAAIAERDRSLGGAAQNLVAIGPRIDAIEKRAAEIEGMGAEASKSLANLVDISRQIMVSAVNAGLIASRISSNGPLTVLAAAAQSQALGCSRRIEDCTLGVVELISTMEALGLTSVRGELDGVTEAAAKLGVDAGSNSPGAGLSDVGPRIAAIVTVLSRIGVEVERRLTAVGEAMDSLEAGVAPLRAADRQPRPDIDPKSLDDLRAIYTMQLERDIHDLALGIVPTVSAPAEGADLDDVFF